MLHFALLLPAMTFFIMAGFAQAEQADEEEDINLIVYALNSYDHDGPFFGPIFLGGSGVYKYKNVDDEWVIRCHSVFSIVDGVNVPGMHVDTINMSYHYEGQYGEECFEGDGSYLVGIPECIGFAPYEGVYKETITTLDDDVFAYTKNYSIWVDDAYDEYTNTASMVYPKLVNQTAQEDFVPGEFVEGYVSPFVNHLSLWENGDVWIVANSANDSSATPRGIYRLDVENLSEESTASFYLTVFYYHPNRTTKFYEQTFFIPYGMRQLTIGNFPNQTQYDNYYMVIQIANFSLDVNTAFKYRLRVGRTKPIILVHGIRSGPRSQSDMANGDIFCDNLHEILQSNYYCKCYFLLHHSGNDNVADVISGTLSENRTNYLKLLEYTHKAHGNSDDDNKAVVIAHSEGATMTRLYAIYATEFVRDIAKVLTFGGVHLGSAFANCWPDTTSWLNLLLGSGGITIEVKNILEIGGCVSLWNNAVGHSLPVPLYAFNGRWGNASDLYMRDLFKWPGDVNFRYSEIERVYPGYSDGMVPAFSACPNNNAQRNYLIGSVAGMAHDRPETVGGTLYTETHVTWANYKEHPTYANIVDIVFHNETPNGGPIFQEIGCAIMPTLVPPPDIRDHYYSYKNNAKVGEIWWQDEDRRVPDIPGVKRLEKGAYMLMAPSGTYAIMRETLAVVYEYFTSWGGLVTNGYATNLVMTNVLERMCTVTADSLTEE
jgi:hypothetical protein